MSAREQRLQLGSTGRAGRDHGVAGLTLVARRGRTRAAGRAGAPTAGWTMPVTPLRVVTTGRARALPLAWSVMQRDHRRAAGDRGDRADQPVAVDRPAGRRARRRREPLSTVIVAYQMVGERADDPRGDRLSWLEASCACRGPTSRRSWAFCARRPRVGDRLPRAAGRAPCGACRARSWRRSVSPNQPNEVAERLERAARALLDRARGPRGSRAGRRAGRRRRTRRSRR